MANGWGSDVPVSMPDAVDANQRQVPMFGFVFTTYGLAHDLSAADRERMATPTFVPEDFGIEIRGDRGLD